MLEKLPLPALIGGVVIAAVWMVLFQIWAITYEVVGVFLVSAVIIAFATWLAKRRQKPQDKA